MKKDLIARAGGFRTLLAQLDAIKNSLLDMQKQESLDLTSFPPVQVGFLHFEQDPLKAIAGSSFLNIEKIAAILAVQPAAVGRWLLPGCSRRVPGEKSLPYTPLAEEKLVKCLDLLNFLDNRKNYILTPSIRKRWGIDTFPFFAGDALSRNGLVTEASITKMFPNRAKRNVWNLIKPAGWSIIGGAPASRLYYETDVDHLAKTIRGLEIVNTLGKYLNKDCTHDQH